MPTLFTKIIQNEIPSVKIYEDELCIAILDIAPVNKGHALVIVKNEYETLLECPDETLFHLITTAKRLAAKMKKKLKFDGFNIMINNGAASGQEVPHLHIHIIPRFKNDGKTPTLKKERYSENEMADFGRILSE
ncbi:MAG: HIT domain-containing protein [Bacteroidetes bacterium]|nr:HIT domain-containing protein [Bacteroidota bacterium]